MKKRRHSCDIKHVKKRTRRRSSSRDVSEGSPPVKKRKQSNRKSLDYGRKVQKKKRKRHASISSTNSDSRSCSRKIVLAPEILSCNCELFPSSLHHQLHNRYDSHIIGVMPSHEEGFQFWEIGAELQFV